MHVIQVTAINSVVDRVTTSEGVVIDVFRQFLSCKLGDNIQVSIVETPPSVATKYLVMRGHIYYVGENASCISCGGLLCSVPRVLQIYNDVYVVVCKSKGAKTRNRPELESTRSVRAKR